MAEYKYVKKFTILDKGEFWIGVMLITTGPLCLLGAVTYMALPWQPPEPMPDMIQIMFMLIIGFFNTINGAIRLFPNEDGDRKKPYEVKRKRVKLTEAEKLLGD
jgi:hypothetical protein